METYYYYILAIIFLTGGIVLIYFGYDIAKKNAEGTSNNESYYIMLVFGLLSLFLFVIVVGSVLKMKLK